MINSVRQTVMSTLNKNNYGYISPSDFNLFAKQAQLDIFENYFYQYNYQLNKENARAKIKQEAKDGGAVKVSDSSIVWRHQSQEYQQFISDRHAT